MARLPTSETLVADALLTRFKNSPGVIVHAWHPPSSKAYFGPLVRVPRKGPDVRTRERYHLDGIVQLGPYLLLVELKGDSANLVSDAVKLAELMSSYTLRELANLLARRVHDVAALAALTSWIPCYGYLNDTGNVPRSGVVVRVHPQTSLVSLTVHRDVPAGAASLLRHVIPG